MKRMKTAMARWIPAVFLCCLSVVGCSEHADDTEYSAGENEKYPVQEGWNSKILVSKAGSLQAVVQYGHMIKYEGEDVILIDQGVTVDFYSHAGEHTSSLTSDRGQFNEKTEDIVGLGRVSVVSDSGVTLHTEILHWDNKRGKIFSDTLVMVTTRDSDTLYGIGFESNSDLTRRVLRKPWGKSSRSLELHSRENHQVQPNDTVK